MANAESGAVEAEDVTMVESRTPTTTDTLHPPSATRTAMAVGTDSEPKNGMRVVPHNI